MDIIQEFSNKINLPISRFTGSSYTVDNIVEDKGNSYHIKSRIIAPRLLEKYLGSDVKIDALFSTYSWFSGMEFNKFFTFEVIKLLETIAINKHRYNCDLNKIDMVLEYLKRGIKEHNEDIDRKHIDKTFEFKILPHQEATIKKYLDFKYIMGYRGMLLHGEPGIGKTAISCFIMEGLHKEISNVIILCPLPTVYEVWDKTLSGLKGTGFKSPQSRYIVKEGKPYKGEKYIICHYEGLDKLMDILHKLPYVSTAVIVDESHNLNDPKSKRTQLALQMVDKLDSANVLLLSGTPIKSGFRELGSIFKFIDQRFQGDVEDSYYKLYSSPTSFLQETLLERYNGYTSIVKKSVIKLQPVETVNLKLKLPDEKVKPFYLSSIKVKLREYITTRLEEIKSNMTYWEMTYNDLLEKAIVNSHVSDTEVYYYKEDVRIIKNTSPREYYLISDKLANANKFEKDNVIPYLNTKEEKDLFRDAKTIYKYPALKVKGEALGKIIGKARIDCHAMMSEYIDYAPIINGTRKKTIIFSNYIDVCNKVMNITKKIGYKPIGVFGEDSKKLVENVNTFDKKPKINPLVTTYKSLSTGVPLIMADTIVCIDLPFRMYQYEQAISRAWRLGQDSNVRVYIAELLTDAPTINTRNIDIISFFNDEVEKITGVTSSLTIKGEDTVQSVEEYVDEIDAGYNINVTTESIENNDVTLSLEAKPNPKRKEVEDLILKYIGKVVTGKENVELYKELFASMSDLDFDNFMHRLKDGKATLSVIIPTNSNSIKVDIENNIKLAKELGYDFFQRLNISKTEDTPAYTTPNKYMVLKLPVRRAAQLLSKKMSVPDDNRHIDSLTGQVVGPSKGASITNPELQILLGLNLKDSIKELIKIRGGDEGSAAAMNLSLFKTGSVTQATTDEASSGVTSKSTFKSYLNGMHIRNTL